MAHPDDAHTHAPQSSAERAALGGDAASQALNEALTLSFKLLKLVMLAVALLFFGSGLFQVKQYEQAFVLRFGRIVEHEEIDPTTHAKTTTSDLRPGFHFAWPFLIDEIVRFPIQRVIEEPVPAFWYKPQPQGPTASAAVPAGIAPGQGGFNLTGDANILHSGWRIQYRIANPVKLCARLADPSALAAEGKSSVVRNLVVSVLRNAVIRTVARYHVDDAYRRSKARLRREVRDAVQLRLKQLDVGIEVHDVILDAIVPPRQSKDAFDEVIQAEQENSELIHKAQGDANETINQAKGQASRTKAEAEAYKNRIGQQADADAKYIQDLRDKYPDSPQLLNTFLEQRLIEVIEETLTAADEVFVVEARGPKGRRQVRILTNRDPKLARQKKPDEKSEK